MTKPGIGIFQGKKARYNKLIFETLYKNGPLTLWAIAKEIRKLAKENDKIRKDIENRTYSIQSVVSRRLKDLQKKKYVRKLENKRWILLFKGVIAFLIIETKPKPWGKGWTDIIPKLVLPMLSDNIPNTLKYDSEGVKIQVSTEKAKAKWKEIYEGSKDFKTWITLANASKKLMEQGVINLDLISNELLVQLLINLGGSALPEGFANGDAQRIAEVLTEGIVGGERAE